MAPRRPPTAVPPPRVDRDHDAQGAHPERSPRFHAYCGSLLDDEEFEAFQGVDQLRELDFEPMVTPQLLTEKHHRENGAAPFGVGLKVPGPLAIGGGKTQQRQNERGQRSDEQQRLEALGAFRSRVAQCEPEAVALEVATGLLDLHALSVDALDAGAGAAVMRQRGGEQPRSSVHLSILRAMSSAFAGPARSTTSSAHQIQPAPVSVTARQTSPADVAHARRGLSIQRIGEAPPSRFRFQVLDAVTNTPHTLPSKGLHTTKPRTAESRIGDLGDKATHDPLVRLAQPTVVQPPQRPCDEVVGAAPVREVKVDRLAAGQEVAHLLEGAQPFDVESQDHPPMIPSPPRSGSCLVGFAPPVQAHLSWDKTASRHADRFLVRCGPERQTIEHG